MPPENCGRKSIPGRTEQPIWLKKDMRFSQAFGNMCVDDGKIVGWWLSLSFIVMWMWFGQFSSIFVTCLTIFFERWESKWAHGPMIGYPELVPQRKREWLRNIHFQGLCWEGSGKVLSFSQIDAWYFFEVSSGMACDVRILHPPWFLVSFIFYFTSVTFTHGVQV